MRAVAVHRGEETPRVVEVPKPKPGPGEVLVETHRVGVDGTDHEVIAGNHGGFPAGDDYQILGHEAVGTVVDPNGTGFEVGDVVVPTVRRPPEGTNEYFERGEPDMAPDGRYLERGIVGAHGYMAEYFTSPAEFLVPIPESLASHGFLVEPTSNAEKALDHAFSARSAFDWRPESALVLGNGPLGLLTLALVADSFDRLYCLGRRDRPDPTIDVIEGLGATYVDSRETPVPDVPAVHEPADLVVEATGHAKHAFETVRALAPNGVGALLGVPEDWTFEVDGGRVHRELVMENKALVGSVNSHVPHFEAAIDSVAAFPDWFVDDLVTTVVPAEEPAAAFATDDGTIKTAVEFAPL
ncbi:glucose 1-dehydrogenase [Haloarchaeobius iranensis]|uniref:Glucose 1-dehydrogenase n=1 Tax=Haloarchaeobius iranensis TaxID=996166 RepID=A0A1G9UWG4_9EURY|nr:glucose 1-dehydrogenase [Haloarchaeobius iranensis]SDM64206.1 Threonine dehydrogenase [Haloarchaeobius iranensis]